MLTQRSLSNVINHIEYTLSMSSSPHIPTGEFDPNPERLIDFTPLNSISQSDLHPSLGGRDIGGGGGELAPVIGNLTLSIGCT